MSLVHNGKNLYAIKAISRSQVDEDRNLSKYFVDEKKIMQTLDHPLIIRFVKSLKNEDFCFFLLEFINGDNMSNYLSKKEILSNENDTRFYIASLLVIIDYLHKKSF